MDEPLIRGLSPDFTLELGDQVRHFNHLISFLLVCQHELQLNGATLGISG